MWCEAEASDSGPDSVSMHSSLLSSDAVADSWSVFQPCGLRDGIVLDAAIFFVLAGFELGAAPRLRARIPRFLRRTRVLRRGGSGAARGLVAGFGCALVLRTSALSGSGSRVRCREMDSPGSRPLPSHSMGASISVEGLKALGGPEREARRSFGSIVGRCAAVLGERLAGEDKGNRLGRRATRRARIGAGRTLRREAGRGLNLRREFSFARARG